MDINLAFACVGYGAVRMLKERDFSTAPYAVPANWILKKPDPVQFCIEAMGDHHPDWVDGVDAETRAAIHTRLKNEAMRAARH
jgi:hypothetical protein